MIDNFMCYAASMEGIFADHAEKVRQLASELRESRDKAQKFLSYVSDGYKVYYKGIFLTPNDIKQISLMI